MAITTRLDIWRMAPILLLMAINTFGAGKVSPNEVFYQLKTFVNSLPSSFVAEVSSGEIETDIEKIPRIYIKNTDIRPKLLLYFSQDWGVKIWMNNVARGIAKQYMTLGKGFEILLPFFKAKSYEDFHTQYDILPISDKVFEMRDHVNVNTLYYSITMDPKTGFVQQILQKVKDKTGVSIQFFYFKSEGKTLIRRMILERLEKPIRWHEFVFRNYDINPHLVEEDFLG